MHLSPSHLAFEYSPYHSIKHFNYFSIYDNLLLKYVGKPIIFVEIGVLDGGSLFMWRKFLGPEARIIGIDLNPSATKWREFGFEIFIGDQADFSFWASFFKSVGTIDVLLDDGGHTNYQQIVTLLATADFVRNGGTIIIEDTHTSYMKFGNFKKASFIEFSKKLIDEINRRHLNRGTKLNGLSKCVFAITQFESISAFHIDTTKCVHNSRVENHGEKDNSDDFRYATESYLETFFKQLYDLISVDYPNEAKRIKYPVFYSFTSRGIQRVVLRSLIIPFRFVIYFILKTLNLKKLMNLIKQSKKY